MPSYATTLRLAQSVDPRYCDGCGGHSFGARDAVTVVSTDGTRARMTYAPAYECADALCGVLTVITARSARRLRSLRKRPSLRVQSRR